MGNTYDLFGLFDPGLDFGDVSLGLIIQLIDIAFPEYLEGQARVELALTDSSHDCARGLRPCRAGWSVGKKSRRVGR